MVRHPRKLARLEQERHRNERRARRERGQVETHLRRLRRQLVAERAIRSVAQVVRRERGGEVLEEHGLSAPRLADHHRRAEPREAQGAVEGPARPP